MMRWIWIDPSVVLALHEEHLAEHGGQPGMRDEGLLASALARPGNKAAYDPGSDAATLAAAYAFGVARNHPFLDGNKRTAFIAARLFLDLNGFDFVAEDTESFDVFLALAAGEIGEEAMADWFRKEIKSSR